ncbi:hypothetical protein M2D63_007835 [Pseudomonas sp. BJa5]|uniref:hypothetical protein n=1 Tax=Pseudomonas sp. BJa5 TaxID=2936270 RepID=UPI002559DB58|nr:hypothetical protein [Pseudomonas sp. BGr12]MDL2421019.1 hypothetical protein [Pseudomonas sp. BGr12]
MKIGQETFNHRFNALFCEIFERLSSVIYIVKNQLTIHVINRKFCPSAPKQERQIMPPDPTHSIPSGWRLPQASAATSPPLRGDARSFQGSGTFPTAN